MRKPDWDWAGFGRGRVTYPWALSHRVIPIFIRMGFFLFPLNLRVLLGQFIRNNIIAQLLFVLDKMDCSFYAHKEKCIHSLNTALGNN